MNDILFPIHALSNIDIEQVLNIYKVKGKVVSRDNIPNKIPVNSCLVINLDDSTGQGTHWVCLCNSQKSKRLLYYDAFGIDYPPQEVLDMKSKKGIVANNSQHQHIDSILCGYYCLKVIKSVFVDKMNYMDTMRQFTDNPSYHNKDIADNLQL